MLSRTTLLYFLTLLMVLVPVLSSSAPATPKQQLTAALALRSEDPEASYRALQQLAATGHGRSTERLAYYTLKGIGTAPDPQAALVLYQRAVAAGHDKALVPLGKLQIKTGDHQAALSNLQTARDLGLKDANEQLLLGHAAERFGPLSAPERAWPQLLQLANDDNRTAALGVLYVAGKFQRRLGDDTRIIAGLLRRAEEGDSKAAEALLRHFRQTRQHRRHKMALRLTLIEQPGLRPKVWSEEALYLAVERRPGWFWTDAEAILAQSAGDGFARGLVVTRKLNRNAYVRVLQSELAQLGYAPGRANGYLHRRTIAATTRFCADHGLSQLCRQGPLSFPAVKAIAAQLAALRG